MLILKTHARSHLEWSTLEHNELCLNTDPLHFTSHTFKGNHLVECVDFSDLSSATVGRATTQLGRFTLCGTTAAELNNPVPLMHAPGGCMQGVERFGRFNKHGSILDLPHTPEICTLSVTSHAENM